MPAIIGPPSMSLAEALWHCADASLASQLRRVEACFSDEELGGFGTQRLSDAAFDPVQAPRQGAEDGVGLVRTLSAIRHQLKERLRHKLEQDELRLTGAQTRPIRRRTREEIPGVFARELEFDFRNDIVRIDRRRYIAVRVFVPPGLVGSRDAVADAASFAPLTVDSVRELTDEEVLILLEDHARRVIEGPDARLIAPGKISLLPIVRGKMRHRADHGELLQKLSDEAHWLADWIGSKVTLHQVPTAATIAKVLSAEYAVLKTRSKAAIQKFKS